MTAPKEALSWRAFEIAGDYGLLGAMAGQRKLAPSDFYAFRRQYLRWADQRDAAMERYLLAEHGVLRAMVPPSDRAHGIATDVAWYFDEIVMDDPVAAALMAYKTENRAQLQAAAVHTADALRRLLDLRAAIEAGFVLLRSRSSVLVEAERAAVGFFEKHKLDDDTLELFASAAKYGVAAREENEDGWVQPCFVRLDWSFVYWFNCNINPGKTQSFSPFLKRQYEMVGRDKFLTVGGEDWLEKNFAPIAQRELERLVALVVAAQLEGGVGLFDAPHHARVLDAVMDTRDAGRYRSVEAAGLGLPYLKGVPISRLVELRSRKPAVFRSFRARLDEMAAIVASAESDIARERELAGFRRQVAQELAELEAESGAAAEQFRLGKLGMSIALGTAAVTASSVAGPVYAAVTAALAAGGAGLSIASEWRAAKKRLEGRPAYFIWEATKTWGRK